jgi:hypothetical protein
MNLLGERTWTYLLTGDTIDIVANMALKKLSIKGIVGVGTVQGTTTVTDGVSSYPSTPLDVNVGDIITLNANGNAFIDAITITAGAGVTLYLLGAQ